jgi:aminoglycoside phosphotransferase (APT) family kinase protein
VTWTCSPSELDKRSRDLADRVVCGHPTARREIAESMVDTLASLHAVDCTAIGLREFGKP